ADSLLFGHRKGSFTGAAESHAGHFERANGGTLFLDELTSLSDLLQIKLLRALDDGVILPLGAIVERHLDIRVVAAAQEDIYEAVRVGSLRSDLFQRVAGVIVRLPALAERPEDIFPLAEHFARVGNRTLEAGVEGVLLDYPWPRNVRELRMTIERAGCLVDSSSLSACSVVEAIELGIPKGSTGPSTSRKCPGSGLGRLELLQVCKSNGWKAKQIASSMGIHRATLFRR